MRPKVTTALVAAFLLAAPLASHAALANYSQDFEALVQASPTALGDDGWKVFGNVFSPDHSVYYYGYGTFPAPNNAGGFCGIDFTPEPGFAAQDMVVFSDYNNGDHAAGNQIEANVFQEQTVDAADVGSSWTFHFDAKLGNLAAPTTALAFIKTLNPAAGYATTNFLTVDMTAIPSTWNGYSLSIAIDPSLVGQILQFGFSNTCTSHNPSGVFYDNVGFTKDVIVPTTPTTWGRVKAMFR
jgi:hypothetical protein